MKMITPQVIITATEVMMRVVSFLCLVTSCLISAPAREVRLGGLTIKVITPQLMIHHWGDDEGGGVDKGNPNENDDDDDYDDGGNYYTTRFGKWLSPATEVMIWVVGLTKATPTKMITMTLTIMMTMKMITPQVIITHHWGDDEGGGVDKDNATSFLAAGLPAPS